MKRRFRYAYAAAYSFVTDVHMIATAITNAAADTVFGYPCRYGCGQRLYDSQIVRHEHTNHAGDRL